MLLVENELKKWYKKFIKMHKVLLIILIMVLLDMYYQSHSIIKRIPSMSFITLTILKQGNIFNDALELYKLGYQIYYMDNGYQKEYEWFLKYCKTL